MTQAAIRATQEHAELLADTRPIAPLSASGCPMFIIEALADSKIGERYGVPDAALRIAAREVWTRALAFSMLEADDDTGAVKVSLRVASQR